MDAMHRLVRRVTVSLQVVRVARLPLYKTCTGPVQKVYSIIPAPRRHGLLDVSRLRSGFPQPLPLPRPGRARGDGEKCKETPLKLQPCRLLVVGGRSDSSGSLPCPKLSMVTL